MTEWQNRIIGEGEENPEQLLANPENWRIHPKLQQDVLSDVLDEVGWVQRVIVNRTTGHMVDGHLRAQLAISRGEPSIPVTYVELTVDEERKILATLDPIAALAATDDEKRQELLAQLSAQGEALSAWVSGMIDPPKLLGDPDAIPDVPAKPITKTGNLWLLGEHRLLCGDSTDAADVAHLAPEGDTVTDPPYGIGYEYSLHDDSSTEVNAVLVRDALALGPGADVFTPGLMNLSRELVRQPKAKVLVWHKGFAQAGNGLGGASTWEPVLCVAVRGGTLPNDHLTFSTDRVPELRDKHPCPKPVALFVHLIEHLTKGSVYDPFAGSGTTLIAAEQAGRRAFLMEIDPAYCDVIVARWEGLTGKKAKRSRT